MTRPRILVFAGSTRSASFNRKLATAGAQAVRDAGGDATLVELSDYEMPIYNGDLEAADGLPDGAKRLKQMFIEHQALLIASPEYNSSITPLLKNTIDWISRKEGDEAPLAAYSGKVVGLTSASPGRLGGLRALPGLRLILSNIGCLVLPGQVAVSEASKAFDAETGELTDERSVKALAKLAGELVQAAQQATT